MPGNPLQVYRKSWVCRLGGHMEAKQDAMGSTPAYNTRLGYCAKCFLPTIPKLLEDFEDLKELLERKEVLDDLRRMTGGQ